MISRSWSGYYVWKLEDAYGRVLDTSTTRYDSYEAAQAAVERFQRVASTAARPSRAPSTAHARTGA